MRMATFPLPARDELAWRELIDAALYQARAPLESAATLARSAARCVLTELPAGERHRQSAFLKLAGLSRRYSTLGERERQMRAPELALLADACEEALDRVSNSPERRRQAPPPWEPNWTAVLFWGCYVLAWIAGFALVGAMR